MLPLFSVFAVYAAQPPCFVVDRGKALSGASINERSSQSPINYKKETHLRLFLFFYS